MAKAKKAAAKKGTKAKKPAAKKAAAPLTDYGLERPAKKR